MFELDVNLAQRISRICELLKQGYKELEEAKRDGKEAIP